MDAVEVAAEVHVVLGPDLAQHLQEFGAAPVALVVFEPRLAEVVNSSLNQPETTLTANRPPDS